MTFTGKIWFALPIILISVYFSQAQSYRFNCFQQASYTYNHKGDTNWLDTAYLVEIDFAKKQVDLHNKAAMNFEIVAFDPLRKEKDGNTIIFNAIDKEGNRCNLELKLFREISFHIATLVVKYGNVMHSYRLQHPKN